MNNSAKIKYEICEIGRQMYEKGYSPGSSGNISCRIGDEILVTASGCCLGKLSAEDVISVDMQGNVIGKHGLPSSERFMHIEIYKRRPDVSCIIHAHSPKSTAMSIAGKEINTAILAEAVIYLGEKIPLVVYETPSTHELAEMVAENFVNSDAALMANHGAVVCASTLEKAFNKLETVEFLGEMCVLSGLLGTTNHIPQNKIAELLKIREKLKNA
jgi:L-fuculose-phosphate aldolase